MGGLAPSSRKQCAGHPAHRLELIPPQVPLAEWGARLGGWAVGRNAHWLQPFQRRRSAAKTPTPSSTGVSADDVPQSNATGAADEPVSPNKERPGLGRGG